MVSLIIPQIAGWLPRKWMGAFSTVLIIGVGIDLAMHWQQLLDPILRAGALVLWTRTIIYRTSRESMQLLLLALFLIMLTGVMSVSISYVVQLVLFSPLAMTLLMLNTTQDPDQRDNLTHGDWRRFNLRRFLSRVWASMSWPLMGLVALCALFMVVSISAIFIILPRFNFRQMMPSFSVPGIAKTGFSEEFRIGSVNQIMQDGKIAFRVEVPDAETMPEMPYWRMLVLDVYRDGNFARSTRFAHKLRPLDQFTSDHFVSNRMIENPGYFTGEDWVFYLEGSISRYLPIPGSFRSIQFQTLQRLKIDPIFATFNLGETSSQVTSFRLSHVIPDESFRASPIEDLAKEKKWTPISPQDRSAVAGLQYPDSTLSAILTPVDADYLETLVNKIKALKSPTYQENVIQYLHQNHLYSLSSNVRTGGSNSDDPVIAWMQSNSPGHCEYFAAAATLLFRANDIPARIVTGFVGGEWNRTREVYNVRNFNAHAWCEIYSDSSEWTRVDPTPGSRLLLSFMDLEGSASTAFDGWFSWMDGIKLSYYRTIVGFDDQTQYQLISQIGIRLSRANIQFGRLGNSLSKWFNEDHTDKNESSSSTRNPKWILITFAVILFVGLGGFAAYQTFTWLGRPKGLTFRVNSPEQRYRVKAKQLLDRVDRPASVEPEIHTQMLTIRFGPQRLWEDPEAVFKEFRTQLKRSHKKSYPQSSHQ